ncbi:hypothetical protein [Bradyrhizobium sp. CCBAU 45384]|uniref:hypothetical protein n=1 Tax=Bradyrhizobium sp. CCBAU 45384 TaxID=858428 RepID=UPI0023056EAD|nr:hypothetical protein [Bradyrhizobium sp. CCBAU 45384]
MISMLNSEYWLLCLTDHDNDNSNSASTVGNERSTGDRGIGGCDNNDDSYVHRPEEYYFGIEDGGHGGYEIVHGILPLE